MTPAVPFSVGILGLPELIGELNEWRPQVHTEMATLRAEVARLHGEQLLQSQATDQATARARAELEAVATQGASMVTVVVDGFRQEIAKTQHTSTQGLQCVVAEAQAKFDQLAGQVDTLLANQRSMVDELRKEFEQRTGQETKLRQDLQKKFDELERRSSKNWWPESGTSAAPAAAAPSLPPGGAGSGPPGISTWRPDATTHSHKAYSVTGKWGTHKHLDLLVAPEVYMAWRDRALGYLTKDRQDVRRLLVWAESHTGPIGEVEEGVGAVEVGLALQAEETVGDVCHALYEGIKDIVSDTLLTRARACGDGRGLELWRKLKSEWEGAAPQVIAAKARRYNDPARCGSTLALWEELPKWEQLGIEVAAGGCQAPDMLKSIALDKLVPEDMLKQIVGRPELATFDAKLRWVKAQMEYVKGTSRALQVQQTPAQARGRTQGDVDMGNLQLGPEGGAKASAQSDAVPDVLFTHLNEACSEKAKAGDYEGVSVLANILANLKGKGKGRGKSGGGGPWSPGKGGGFGGSSYGGSQGSGYGGGAYGGGQGNSKGAGKQSNFEGTCNFCGKYGHKKSQCRALDAEMQAKGKGKGKGLNNTEGEEGSAEGHSEQGASDQGSDEATRWWLGLNHMKPEALPKKTWFQCGECGVAPSSLPKCAFMTANKFAELTEEAEEDDECWPPIEAARPYVTHGARTQASKEASRLQSHVRKAAKESQKQRRQARQKDYTLCPLTKGGAAGGDGELSVNALGKKVPGAVLVEAVLDSGAADSVSPPGVFPAPVTPSEMSKNGFKYEGPDKSKIPNLGQTEAEFGVDEGYMCGLRMQVADIARPLIAASHLADGGNTVQLGKTGGAIINEKTGKRISVARRGGIYVLRMWVAPPKQSAAVGESENKTASSFTRPGSKA